MHKKMQIAKKTIIYFCIASFLLGVLGTNAVFFFGVDRPAHTDFLATHREVVGTQQETIQENNATQTLIAGARTINAEIRDTVSELAHSVTRAGTITAEIRNEVSSASRAVDAGTGYLDEAARDNREAGGIIEALEARAPQGDCIHMD